jgi:hypothetical protein
MQIAKSGDTSLLNAGANAMEVWEEIVRKNCIANGVHEYTNYISALRSHALLVNDYISIKAHLIKLSYVVDEQSIEYLKAKGYVVDKSSTEAYTTSLVSALKKRENLMTRINMKKKELERIALQHKSGDGDRGIEEILATVSFQIGFSLSDDITLARFNEYVKIIKVQQTESQKHGRNK